MSKTNASKEIVYSYIINKGQLSFETTHIQMVYEINKDLPPRDKITLMQLRLALKHLSEAKKVTTSIMQYGLLIMPIYQTYEPEKQQPKKKELKSLFKKELNTIQWEIIKFLELHCVGVEKAMFANELIKQLNEFCGCYIKSDVEFRLHMKIIKRSRVFKRRVNTSPQKGYWLALESEKYDIGYATRKNLEAIATDIANNTNINIYFDFLNKLTSDMAINKQGRFVFHTEKDQISVYSDDKIN